MDLIYRRHVSCTPYTAAVHRRPLRPENAARADGPPAAGPAPVRRRRASGRDLGGRCEHLAGRRWRRRWLQAADRDPEGAQVQRLRPTACPTAESTREPGQNHQDVDDGTTGQNHVSRVVTLPV